MVGYSTCQAVSCQYQNVSFQRGSNKNFLSVTIVGEELERQGHNIDFNRHLHICFGNGSLF
jgi:hypothetical protein